MTNKKILEKWFQYYLDKRIRKTEMYFIIKLDTKFDIKRVSAKFWMKNLIDKKIKELHVFVKYRMGYTLSKIENSYYIHTPHLYFKLKTGYKKEEIFNFMNEHLNLII